MNPRTLAQTALFTAGVLFVGGATALALWTDLASQFPFGRGVLGAVGLLMIATGLYSIRSRREREYYDDPIAHPEYALHVAPPGSELDSMLFSLLVTRHGAIDYPERIHDRLQEAAIAVIRYQEDCTEEQAREQIEAGSWTDDRVAANYLAGRPAQPDLSIVDRLLGRTDSSSFSDMVRRTVNALLDRANLEIDVPQEESSAQPDGVFERIRQWFTSSDQLTGSAQGTRQYPGWYYQLADEDASAVIELDVVSTNHWQSLGSIALITAGVGVFANVPGLVLAGGAIVAYALVARSATPATPEALSFEREFSEPDPDPGDEVEVTLTVENIGNRPLPDLRLVEFVPESFVVVDGSIRLATALMPGETTQMTYSIVAQRGEHDWPIHVAIRDPTGAVERQSAVRPDAPLRCLPSLLTAMVMPVRSQTSQFAGEVATQTGGSGLEFFSVREYRDGDPMKRIDWGRLAKTGDLATIDLREEKAASVVLLFDTRDAAYVSPGGGAEHAVDRAIRASGEIFSALFDQGHLVGMAAFDTVPLWLSPGAGTKQYEEVRHALATHPAMSPVPPSQGTRASQQGYVDPMTHVRRQLPQNAQVILFSPLCDDYSAEVAQRLDSSGHRVTVISPNPTSDRTIGQNLARVERMMRVNSLRERGLRIMDWDYDEPLLLEMNHATVRWAH